MTRKIMACAILVLATVSAPTLTLRPAEAAPPTVVPSPGYDARLREERAAQSAPVLPSPPSAQPAASKRHHRSHRAGSNLYR